LFTRAQQAPVTTGNEAIGSGGSASYSVGQIMYTTNTGTTGSMAQGVQHPYEIATLGTDNFPELTLKFSAYPNPTTDMLTLSIENYEVKNLSYQLIDITGKIIQTNKITQDQTIIDMSNRIPAAYFFAISENNKMLKTFKIMKK
jgi:hypothetical protein